MQSPRSNQFEIKSLSAPLRAHPLKRSNRSHNPSHLSTPPSVSTRYKSTLRFLPNSPPLTTNHHGGQRPPPGAPPAGSPVPQHRSTSLQPICFQTYHSTSAAPQSQGPQVMLSLRWNQFENQSLSAPVRAHGLRRQVMQSLSSNRSNSTSHLSILPCVISKTKNEIDFDTNAPPSLTTSQHGGQRPPVGAPPVSYTHLRAHET